MRTSLLAPLAVLSHIQDPSETRISGLPSWVPDFSAKLGRMPFDEGGYEDRFRAGPPFRHLDPDGTLSLEGAHVKDVLMSTNLEGDLLVQILTLALHSPAEKQHNSLSWWSLDMGACAPSGALCPVWKPCIGTCHRHGRRLWVAGLERRSGKWFRQLDSDGHARRLGYVPQVCL